METLDHLVGEQNMPPQNVSGMQIILSWKQLSLKRLRKNILTFPKKTQEEHLTFPKLP